VTMRDWATKRGGKAWKDLSQDEKSKGDLL